MKKFSYVFLFFAIIACLLHVHCGSVFATPKQEDTNFGEYFESLFGVDIAKKANKTTSLFVSGMPVGFALSCEGVVVVCVGKVDSPAGLVCPCDGIDLKQGDVILSIDGTQIESSKTIEKVIEQKDDQNEPFELAILRERKRFSCFVVPALDKNTNKRKLGLWIRDNTAGIGTLTYVTKEGRFGALGHPVCDNDTNVFLPISGGNLFSCNVVGQSKGVKGKTGELKGVFVRSKEPLGEVCKNCEFGLFGDIAESKMNSIIKQEYPVATRSEVHPGAAKIFSTINGMQPKEYDIEIVKTTNQPSQKAKSMVVRVVDPELLAATGGIVQGMSGSPIIQDGKFVGALTHVFVSDPSKGFAVYGEWMLEE